MKLEFVKKLMESHSLTMSEAKAAYVHVVINGKSLEEAIGLATGGLEVGKEKKLKMVKHLEEVPLMASVESVMAEKKEVLTEPQVAQIMEEVIKPKKEKPKKKSVSKLSKKKVKK